MSELAQFGDEHNNHSSDPSNEPNVPSVPSNDPYYTEKIWFGEQSEDGGLTQADIDDLAYRMRDNPEIDEHDLSAKYLAYGQWLFEHGRITEWPNGQPIKRYGLWVLSKATRKG